MMKEEKLSRDDGSRAGLRSNGASSIHRSFSNSRKNSIMYPPILEKSQTSTLKNLDDSTKYEDYADGFKETVHHKIEDVSTKL